MSLVKRIRQKIDESRKCRTCAGFYAPSNRACMGCEHNSMYRPVDNETYQLFTYETYKAGNFNPR